MINSIVLVGRIVSDLEIKETEQGKKKINITLAVPRYYKNDEGIYETNFIPCVLFGTLAEKTFEWAKKGDLAGIRGRLQTRIENNENKQKEIFVEVVAEKVTFLSSRKEENGE